MLEMFVGKKVMVQLKNGEKFIAARASGKDDIALMPAPGASSPQEAVPVVLPYVIGTVVHVASSSFALEYEEPDLLNGHGATTHKYRTLINEDIISTITSVERKNITLIGV